MTWVNGTSALLTAGIEERRFRVFLLTLLTLVTVSPLLLLAVSTFDVRTYFVVSFLWLLISSEVFAPSDPESVWWRRLQWVKVAGWLVFAYIVFERIVAVVS